MHPLLHEHNIDFYEVNALYPESFANISECILDLCKGVLISEGIVNEDFKFDDDKCEHSLLDMTHIEDAGHRNEGYRQMEEKYNLKEKKETMDELGEFINNVELIRRVIEECVYAYNVGSFAEWCVWVAGREEGDDKKGIWGL